MLLGSRGRAAGGRLAVGIALGAAVGGHGDVGRHIGVGGRHEVSRRVVRGGEAGPDWERAGGGAAGSPAEEGADSGGEEEK